MAGWDHVKKQEDNALQAMNRGGAYRLVKVVPFDPATGPQMRTTIKGWVTQEIWLKGQSPEDLELRLGFDRRPGRQYLMHGLDAYLITRPIRRGEFQLGGAYTYLPDGKEWDGVDLQWPPGSGAVQWKLIKDVDCRYLKTVRRGQRY